MNVNNCFNGMLDRQKVFLLLIVLMIFQLTEGLLRIDAPYTEIAAYSRSSINAMFARNYYLDGFNFFAPRLDYGPSPGAAIQEFPLIPYLVSLCYFLVGIKDWIGRFLPLVFAIGTTGVVYLWSKRLFKSKMCGLASSLVIIASPTFAYFSRVFQSDTAMIFFGVLAFLLIEMSQEEKRVQYLVFSALSMTICLLLKPSSAVLLPSALFYILWGAKAEHGYGVSNNKLISCLIYAAFVLGAVALFYGWAHWYSSMSDRMGLIRVTKRFAWYHLVEFKIYVQLAKDIFQALTPIGCSGIMVLCYLFVKKKLNVTLFFWLVGLALLNIIFNEALSHHEYYQMIWVPIAAIGFGSLFSETFYNKEFVMSFKKKFMILILTVIVFFSGFLHYEFISLRLKYPELSIQRYNFAKKIDEVVPKNKLILAESIDVLYYSNRRGNTFGGGGSEIDVLRERILDYPYSYLCIRVNTKLYKSLYLSLRDDVACVYSGNNFEIWDISNIDGQNI